MDKSIIPNGYLCIYYGEEIILGRDGKPRGYNRSGKVAALCQLYLNED